MTCKHASFRNLSNVISFDTYTCRLCGARCRFESKLVHNAFRASGVLFGFVLFVVFDVQDMFESLIIGGVMVAAYLMLPLFAIRVGMLKVTVVEEPSPD